MITTDLLVAVNGGRGSWRKGVRRNKLPVIRYINIRDIVYNTMTIADTAVGYIGKMLRP